MVHTSTAKVATASHSESVMVARSASESIFLPMRRLNRPSHSLMSTETERMTTVRIWNSVCTG